MTGAPDRSAISLLVDAMASGDGRSIRETLASDVVLIADGGGVVEPPSRVVDGREEAAGVLAALCAAETSITISGVNGMTGVIVSREGQVVAAVVAQVRVDLLSQVWVVCNPEKLRHWNRG